MPVSPGIGEVMIRYILIRISHGIITLLVISMIVFAMSRATGSPVDLMLPLDAPKGMRQEVIHNLGLDKHIVVQYGIFLGDLVQGDLGRSFVRRDSVTNVIWQKLPASMELTGVAIFVSVLVAVPLGVFAARYRGGWFDGLARGVAVFGQSVPVFWLSLIFILLFAVELGWAPSGGRNESGLIRSYFSTTLILPAAVIAIFIMAGVVRITRSSMLEVFDAEYVKLARLKGLHEQMVIWKHAFKNASLPILTFVGVLYTSVLTGAVTTEFVFAWPGLGRLMVDSIVLRDFPVIQGLVLMFSVWFIVSSLVVDILYAYLNPRIRYGGPESAV